jgi:hypothetical protein
VPLRHGRGRLQLRITFQQQFLGLVVPALRGQGRTQPTLTFTEPARLVGIVLAENISGSAEELLRLRKAALLLHQDASQQQQRAANAFIVRAQEFFLERQRLAGLDLGLILGAQEGSFVHLYRTGTWEEERALRGGLFAFGPDGLLALADGEAIRLADAASGTTYARLEAAHASGPAPSRFSADGSLPAASDQSSATVLVWDLRALREELAARGLDWDRKPYPPRACGAGGTHPAAPATMNRLAQPWGAFFSPCHFSLSP